jgi:prepilin-type N-terminal cleavage/methylation domain-containing protein/prepilin-type processing-associated H-X9-DG protein
MIKKKIHGFTLIEILVVISIIAVLAGILFPVFSSVKRSAKQSSCLANISQQTRGVQLYLTDNSERYPIVTDSDDKSVYWFTPDPEQVIFLKERLKFASTMKQVLNPYLKSPEIWSCPLDSGGNLLYKSIEGVDIPPVADSTYKKRGTSYASNPSVFITGQSDPLQCKSPDGKSILSNSQIAIFLDSSPFWHLRGGADEKWEEKSTNVGYADGHTKFHSQFGSDPYAGGWLIGCEIVR